MTVKLLTREQLVKAHQPDYFQILFRVALEISLAFAGWMMLSHSSNAVTFGIGLVLVSTRQLALLSLMHEAAHGNMHKNKKINDVLGETISSLFFMSMRAYRRHHMKHHQLAILNTKDDPDWQRKQNGDWEFPMPLAKLVWIALKDLSGYSIIELLQEAKAAQGYSQQVQRDLRWMFFRFAIIMTVLGSSFAYGYLANFFLFWFLPFVTLTKFIFRLRVAIDHFMLPNEGPLTKARTVAAHPLERFFFAPCGLAYHLEHHLYPQVPFYRLKAVHEELEKHPQYSAHVVTEKSQWFVLKKMFYWQRYQFRKLTQESDLQRYQTTCARLMDVAFPIEYLKNALVVEYVDRLQQKPMGGFVLVKGPGLRTLQSIPDGVSSGHRESSYLEITGVWLHPSLMRGWVTVKYWLYLFLQVAKSGQAYVIYAYSKSKEGLRRAYSYVDGEVLFDGLTKQLEGMFSCEEEIIQHAPAWKVYLIPLRNPHWSVDKFWRRRALATEESHA